MSQMGLLQQSVRHRSTVASCVQPQLTSWGSEIIAYWTPEFSGAAGVGSTNQESRNVKTHPRTFAKRWWWLHEYATSTETRSAESFVCFKGMLPRPLLTLWHQLCISCWELQAPMPGSLCTGARGRWVSPWQNVALHDGWIQGQLGLLVHCMCIAYELHWPIETLMKHLVFNRSPGCCNWVVG